VGQYYKIAFRNVGMAIKAKVVDPGYVRTSRKLTEHSYIGNMLCDAFAWMIHCNPTKIIWCGDYAEDVEEKTQGLLSLGDIHWDENVTVPKGIKETIVATNRKFNYNGRFLVNHSIREYLDFNDYFATCGGKGEGGDTYNPIPLLTAVGNGLGGGDYYGVDRERYVGAWAWDSISIEDELPRGYCRITPRFMDKRNLSKAKEAEVESQEKQAE